MALKWLTRFTFEREAYWLLWIAVLIPLTGIVIAVIVPRVIRWAAP